MSCCGDSGPSLPGLAVCCSGRGYAHPHIVTCGMGWTTIRCWGLGCDSYVFAGTAMDAYQEWNNLMTIRQPWTHSEWFKQWLELARHD